MTERILCLFQYSRNIGCIGLVTGPYESRKFRGCHYYLVGIICPPSGWDRVNLSAKNLGVPWYPRHPQGCHPCIKNKMIKYQRRLNVINFVEDKSMWHKLLPLVKIGLTLNLSKIMSSLIHSGDLKSSDNQLSQFGLIEEKMSRSHKN